ncbi:hypothetical protein WJX73_001076 [Symbiochloris irregularis]|uniref:CRC domain-containing protein n=1 Tax=Symbiochloris irregularis TaxID=706552 RepID=A0AAW1PUB2_9CHLO
MAGSRDSRPLIHTPEQPSRHHKTPVEASPFSLFAKDLPPITSLHVYAESLSTHSFSPDPTRLPARSRAYGLLSPGAVSRSSDGFDVLASLLPSPLSSPTGPVRIATTSSSASRLKTSHAAPPDTAAQTLQASKRPPVGERMGTRAATGQTRRLGIAQSAAMTSSAAGNSSQDGPLRNFRRRALNFTEQPPSSSNQATPSQTPFTAPTPPIKLEGGMSQLLEASEGGAEANLRTIASLPVPVIQQTRLLPKPAKRRRTTSAITLQTVAPPGTPLPMGRPDTVPDWATRRTRCNCKKTRCLKLYCECFKAGSFCIDCNCSGCGNTDENRVEVTERRASVQERDPQAFEMKFTKEKHRQGCNCKKSGCAKKYCECYEAGVMTEMPPSSAAPDMVPPSSRQEGCDSAATASPPAMVSHLSSSQDAQSYIGADSMPMVLLPIIHAPNALSPEQLDAKGWAAAQAQSPWCQAAPGQGSSAATGDQGSGSGSTTSAAGASTPLPQLYQVLLHKTPDGKLVPYGALAGFSQMPLFTHQEQPAIKHLAFEGEGAGGANRQEDEASISPSALPYLNVSPHSMPAAALLASPSGTAPLGPTVLGPTSASNPHPGFMPQF